MEPAYTLLLVDTESIKNVLLYVIFPLIGTLLLIAGCYATFSVSTRFSSIKEKPQEINLGSFQFKVSLVALIFLIGLFFFSIWLYFLNQDYDDKIRDYDNQIMRYDLEVKKYQNEISALKDNKVRVSLILELDTVGLNGKLPDLNDLEGEVFFFRESRPQALEISVAPAGHAVRIEFDISRNQLIQSIMLTDKMKRYDWKYQGMLFTPLEQNIILTRLK
jgi:hypothetical protein